MSIEVFKQDDVGDDDNTCKFYENERHPALYRRLTCDNLLYEDVEQKQNQKQESELKYVYFIFL